MGQKFGSDKERGAARHMSAEDNRAFAFAARRAQAKDAEIARLRSTMLRCADKLETFGNEEPREVARMLREDAGEGQIAA